MGFRDVLWTLATLDRNVWSLALASFLNDIASEMILILLPIYLHHNLKSPVIVIGLIEGIALAISAFIKGVSGWLSDWLGHRRYLTALGYALSAFARPVLAFASTWHIAAIVRWVDRVGKGLRGAPRDALIADSIAKTQRGVSYGLHRASETAGAVLSLSIALYVLAVEQPVDDDLQTDAYHTIVWLSIPFGLGAVLSVTHLARDVRRRRRASVHRMTGVSSVNPSLPPTLSSSLSSSSSSSSASSSSSSSSLPTPAPSPGVPKAFTLFASSESPRPNAATAAIPSVLRAESGTAKSVGESGAGRKGRQTDGIEPIIKEKSDDEDDLISTAEAVAEYTPLSSSRAIAGVSLNYPPAIDDLEDDHDTSASDSEGDVHRLSDIEAMKQAGWNHIGVREAPLPNEPQHITHEQTSLDLLRATAPHESEQNISSSSGNGSSDGRNHQRQQGYVNQEVPLSPQHGGDSGQRIADSVTSHSPLRKDEVVPLPFCEPSSPRSPSDQTIAESSSSLEPSSSASSSSSSSLASLIASPIPKDEDLRSTAATLDSTEPARMSPEGDSFHNGNESSSSTSSSSSSHILPQSTSSVDTSNSNVINSRPDRPLRHYYYRDVPLYLHNLHHLYYHHRPHPLAGESPHAAFAPHSLPPPHLQYYYRHRHGYKYIRGPRLVPTQSGYPPSTAGVHRNGRLHPHSALLHHTHHMTHLPSHEPSGNEPGSPLLASGLAGTSPSLQAGQSSPKVKLPWYDRLGSVYFTLVGIFCLFQVGNPSDAFLVLLARERGVTVIQLLALMLLYNLVYALVSAPVGWLSDYLELKYQRSRPYVIAIGWLLRSFTFIGMAYATSAVQIWVLFSFHGAYMGIVEGVLKALIVDVVERDASARGMAFGVFNSAMGVCDIGSSFIAGVLWERLGPAYPFLFASSSGCVALVCLLLWSQFVGPAEDVDLPPLPPPKIKVVDDHGDVGAPVKGERTPLLSTTTTTTLGDGYKSLAPIAAASDVGMAVGADKASAHEELRFTSNSNIADLEEGLRAQGYHPYYSRSRGTRKKRFYPVYPPVWLPNWDETHREEDEERRKEWRRYIRRSRSGWTWTNRWSTATNATTQPTAQTNKSSGET